MIPPSTIFSTIVFYYKYWRKRERGNGVGGNFNSGRIGRTSPATCHLGLSYLNYHIRIDSVSLLTWFHNPAKDSLNL